MKQKPPFSHELSRSFRDSSPRRPRAVLIRNLRRIFSLIGAVLLIGAGQISPAADEIRPPFNLNWGVTSDRMEMMLRNAKATIVQRRRVEGREAWDVEGIAQTALRRTVFYFKNGELVEVELQYQKEDWDETKYTGFMEDVKKRIEEKYGAGQLLARKKEHDSIAEVTQTLLGYKWNLNNTAIELIYFAAEKTSQSFRTLSVHYKAY